MQRRILCAVSLSLSIGVATPACAWQRFIGVDPFWVQSLAPSNALSVDGAGNLCVLTNDRVGGQLEFAHVATLGTLGEDVRPMQVIGSSSEFATFGIDCRFGPPVVGYTKLDPGSWRRTVLLGYSDDRQSYWTSDLLSIGSARVARFSVGSAQAAVVLRQKSNGIAFDVEGFAGASSPTPLWQTAFNAWNYPEAEVSDIVAGADGSTRVLGTFSQSNDPGMGIFVQGYDASGIPTTSRSQFGFDAVGPNVLTPLGNVYFVRRSDPNVNDQLWHFSAGSSWPDPINFIYGPAQIERLVALPDDGALTLTESGYNSDIFTLSRFNADGSLRWQVSPPEFSWPGRSVLDVIGDRAGRVLVAVSDPAMGPPPSAPSISLLAYSEQGLLLWTRSVPGARFDQGPAVHLALTSDDRAVVAINGVNADQTIPGIVIQSFTIDSPVP
jgi:hypothetical protein